MVPIGWAYYGDFQSPPAGGGQVIPEWLENMSEYYGAEIFCSTKVTKIRTEDNTSKGLRIQRNGYEMDINSKYVIAASDVETLYEKMLPPRIIPEKLKSRLKNAELYHSSVTISVALDCSSEELGFGEEMIHLSEEEIPFGEHANGDPRTSEISILAPTARDKTLAPEGKGTLTLYMPARIEYKNEWFTEKDSEGNYIRGAAYRKLKNEVAELIIGRVEEKIAPGLRSHILFYEVSTPVTHWRYTGNRNGTIMGAKPGKENMRNGIAHYQTPVKNLILGGHWAELGGGVPIASKAGLNAALIILRKEKKDAFKLLANYVEDKVGLDYINKNTVFKSYRGHWHQSLTPAQKRALRMVSQ
jgi:prolycopene isomerase